MREKCPLRDLETSRLLLRLHTMDDLPELHRIIFSEPDVAEPFAGRVRSLEETREGLREQIWLNEHSGEQVWGYWTIRKHDSRIIGKVLLGHPERVWWTAMDPTSPYTPLFTEVGYALGKSYWGNGYATEAARAVLEYAFRDLRVERFDVPWGKGPRNDRSFRVYIRLGFEVRDDEDVESADVVLTRRNYLL